MSYTITVATEILLTLIKLITVTFVRDFKLDIFYIRIFEIFFHYSIQRGKSS